MPVTRKLWFGQQLGTFGTDPTALYPGLTASMVLNDSSVTGPNVAAALSYLATLIAQTGVVPFGAVTANSIVLWNDNTGTAIKNGPSFGTGANNAVQLDGSGNLPAVSGQSLTGLRFLQLTDTPATFVGETLKLLRVNAAETGIEFFAFAAGTGDVVGPASSTANALAVYNGNTGKLIKDGAAPGAAGGYVRSDGTNWVRAPGVAWTDLTGAPSVFAPSAHTHVWADVTGTPTTIAGYGITDFNSLGDARWSLLAHTHSFASLTAKPTTLIGYGIIDAVPAARTLTINGIAQDLSTNRTWIVGDVLTWGSYIDPSWIVSLSYDKLTGAPALGSTTFTGLTDAPSSYLGKAGHLVQVNPAGTGLQFVDIPTLSFGWTQLTGTPTTIAGYGITNFNSLGDARWSLLGHTHVFASITSTPTTLVGYGIADAQSLNANLTDIAALTTTPYGRGLLTEASAASARTTLGLGALATLNAVATNANLTGPITSVGNATAIAAQTGTGAVFAMQTAPSFIDRIQTPLLDLPNQIAPAAPASAVARIYSVDAAGITDLEYRSSTGFAARVLRDVLYIARNSSGATIIKGTPVYISGTFSGSVILPEISPARANAAATMACAGIAAQDIANNASGRIMWKGRIDNINTSAFAVNDRLWVSSVVAGTFTKIRPSAPTFEQRVATVIHVDASAGSILVDVKTMLEKGQAEGLAYLNASSIVPVAIGGTGNATGTATINANLTGPVTSAGNATAIADAALSIAKIIGLQAALDAKLSPSLKVDMVYTGGSQISAVTTLANVHSSAALVFASTGLWAVRIKINYNANAFTTGAWFTLNGDGTLAQDWLACLVSYTTLNTDRDGGLVGAFDGGIVSASSAVLTGNGAFIIGDINVTTPGSLLLRFASEVAVASGIVVTGVSGWCRRTN